MILTARAFILDERRFTLDHNLMFSVLKKRFPQIGPRVCSAAMAIAIILVIHFWGGLYGWLQLIGLLAILVQREYTRLAASIGSFLPQAHIHALVLTGLFIAGAGAILAGPLGWGLPFIWETFAAFLLCSLLFLLLWLGYRIEQGLDLKKALNEIALMWLGYGYVGLLPLCIFFSVTMWGREPLYTVLIIVLGGDISAYFLGLLWGNSRIAPKISPKKSWWGAIGGLAGGFIGSVLSWNLWGLGTGIASLPCLMLLGVICSAAGQAGDFFESALKRAAGVKDSGNFMPGHGGVLDRVDGVLFAAPVYTLVLVWGG